MFATNTSRMASRTILAHLLIGTALLSQSASERTSTLKDQKGLAVTIYNENLALVRDLREVNLPSGNSNLAYQDVSARISPETALLRNQTNPSGFWVNEQNFDFDLLTPAALLDKYIGKKVMVISQKPNPDGPGSRQIQEEAEVLATTQGVVLKFADRIESSAPGRIVFPRLPENLRARPTLVMNLHSNSESTQKLELSYLTGGLSWRADYVANLSPSEKELDLSGWVTLTNQSGAIYPEATLQLMAGDLNRVQEEFSNVVGLTPGISGYANPNQMKEENLFEYHLYTLDHPTTLKENQTKQVALLSAAKVPVKKSYLLIGNRSYYQNNYNGATDKLKVGVYLNFANRSESGMGMPMPKGTVRVYKRDSEGRSQFVGEDAIDHTPKNEIVNLKLGDAFDITARRKQTDFKSLGSQGQYNYVYEAAFEVEFKNAKKEAVMVSDMEPLWGDWEIVEKSHPFTKETSGSVKFNVEVPAEGSAKLTYRARIRW